MVNNFYGKFLLQNSYCKMSHSSFSHAFEHICLIFAFVILGVFNGNAGVEKVLETLMVLKVLALIMRRYH